MCSSINEIAHIVADCKRRLREQIVIRQQSSLTSCLSICLASDVFLLRNLQPLAVYDLLAAAVQEKNCARVSERRAISIARASVIVTYHCLPPISVKARRINTEKSWKQCFLILERLHQTRRDSVDDRSDNIYL